MKKHIELLNQLVEKQKADKSNTSMILTGSVAYGAATEDSDLDIIVICDRDQFVSENMDGILVEIHYNKFETLNQRLEKNPMEIYKYLFSRVIFDDGLANQLIIKAREEYSSYIVPAADKESIRYWLSATKAKLQASINSKDMLRVSYLVSTNTWKVLEGVWAINNKPMPPSSLAFHKRDAVNISFDNWFEGLFIGDVLSRANMMIYLIDIICGQ